MAPRALLSANDKDNQRIHLSENSTELQLIKELKRIASKYGHNNILLVTKLIILKNGPKIKGSQMSLVTWIKHSRLAIDDMTGRRVVDHRMGFIMTDFLTSQKKDATVTAWGILRLHDKKLYRARVVLIIYDPSTTFSSKETDLEADDLSPHHKRVIGNTLSHNSRSKHRVDVSEFAVCFIDKNIPSGTTHLQSVMDWIEGAMANGPPPPTDLFAYKAVPGAVLSAMCAPQNGSVAGAGKDESVENVMKSTKTIEQVDTSNKARTMKQVEILNKTKTMEHVETSNEVRTMEQVETSNEARTIDDLISDESDEVIDPMKGAETTSKRKLFKEFEEMEKAAEETTTSEITNGSHIPDDFGIPSTFGSELN